MTSRHDELGRTLRAALKEEADVMPIDTRSGAERLQRELAHSGRRKRRLAAAVVAAAAAAAVAVGVVMWDGQTDVRPSPAPAESPQDEPRPALDTPRGDYVYDMDTGAVTPLPKAITRTLHGSARHGPQGSMYAVSPDGSRLAYVGSAEDGTTQIFTAGIDGSGVRQVTRAPVDVHGSSVDASSPAWSPDGASIAYGMGFAVGDGGDLFVLDVATGESRQVTEGARATELSQFTPDGSSLVYTAGRSSWTVLRTVPVTGGDSVPYIGRDFNAYSGQDNNAAHKPPWIDAANASLSPDGSLVTYLGSPDGPGPVRWLANADGSHRRIIPGFQSNAGGAWSPDGSRIACADGSGGIIVIDVADPHPSLAVAKGEVATWLDDHTLLVERRAAPSLMPAGP